MIEWLRDLAQWVAFATILVLFAHALLTPETAYFDAIRRDAIAQAELEQRNRVARLKATKEEQRREAERRAGERSEREAARLAKWPRKRAFN
jgi:hypothetical protein